MVGRQRPVSETSSHLLGLDLYHHWCCLLFCGHSVSGLVSDLAQVVIALLRDCCLVSYHHVGDGCGDLLGQQLGEKGLAGVTEAALQQTW